MYYKTRNFSPNFKSTDFFLQNSRRLLLVQQSKIQVLPSQTSEIPSFIRTSQLFREKRKRFFEDFFNRTEILSNLNKETDPMDLKNSFESKTTIEREIIPIKNIEKFSKNKIVKRQITAKGRENLRNYIIQSRERIKTNSQLDKNSFFHEDFSTEIINKLSKSSSEHFNQTNRLKNILGNIEIQTRPQAKTSYLQYRPKNLFKTPINSAKTDLNPYFLNINTNVVENKRRTAILSPGSCKNDFLRSFSSKIRNPDKIISEDIKDYGIFSKIIENLKKMSAFYSDEGFYRTIKRLLGNDGNTISIFFTIENKKLRDDLKPKFLENIFNEGKYNVRIGNEIFQSDLKGDLKFICKKLNDKIWDLALNKDKKFTLDIHKSYKRNYEDLKKILPKNEQKKIYNNSLLYRKTKQLGKELEEFEKDFGECKKIDFQKKKMVENIDEMYFNIASSIKYIDQKYS